ncbi:MAG: alcohol dehydrogenase catalytic domain-containing protein, partial [Oscillospiraceae bacterium]
MLQQVMTAPGKIEFQNVEIPEPAARQVQIKMMRIGICGSDIHVYHGEHPFTSYP